MTELKTIILGCALGLGAAAAGAATAPAAMTKQAYQAAHARIEAQLQADQAACTRLQGKAHDLCIVQAKGRRQSAQAQLDAQYKPNPESDRKAMAARADADFALAKAKCEVQKGRAKDACLQQAKMQRDATQRLAVVQKVEKVNALRDRKDLKPPRQETPAQRFAAQKAYCEIQGADRDRCLAELKKRYGKA